MNKEKNQANKLTVRDKIQIKAFHLHYKIFLGEGYDSTCAFGLAIAASSDERYDALTPEQKKLAASCI